MPTDVPAHYRWQALAIVSFGTLAVHLDTTVNVALPAIASALDSPIPSLQWIIIGYVLTTASTLLVVGRISDIVGRRTIWVGGLVALAVALVLDGLAQSLQMLVAFRMLQAIGASMIYAAGPAIVSEAFPSTERGRALGIMTMGGQVGMAAGPLVGGWLVETFGWPAIFWARAPVALAIGVASWWVIRDLAVPTRRPGFDLGGASTLGLSMVALVLGINRAGQFGWTTPLSLGLFGAAAVLLVVFVRIETRVTSPMIDLGLFRNRLFVTANLTNLLSNLTMFGVWLLVPFYLVQGLLLEPLTAGLVLCCVPAATSLISPVSGWLSDRYGSWWLSLGGLILQIVALVLISRLDAQSTVWHVAAALGLLGVAIGLFVAPNTSFIMGSVPPDQFGVAGGVVTTMRSLGVVMGVALLTTVYAVRSAVYAPASGTGGESPFVIPAFQDSFTFAALVCVLAVGLALVRPRAGSRASGEHAARPH